MTADAVLKMTLADNGGPTKTHALVFDSPAINRMPCVNTIDQRGASRRSVATATVARMKPAFGSVSLPMVNGGSVGRSPAGRGMARPPTTLALSSSSPLE
ncbi:MAG: choice-of-anchor Q domain-containing protein [Chloroflexia bacterium]